MSAEILVHSLAQAEAALAAAAALRVPVILASAPGAGAYGGPLWFKSLIEAACAAQPDAEVSAIIDCGDAAGSALAALRLGMKRVRFTGNEDARARLREIAAQLGAVIEEPASTVPLDLLDNMAPEQACRAFLGQSGLARSGTAG